MKPQAGALALVVPVYNEEARVEPAIERLIDFVAAYSPGSELIFVDDGSADTTVAVIEKIIWRRGPDEECSVRVLQRAHAGKGAAVQAGILDSEAPIVAFCDVDLATPLDELARIIDVAAGGVLAVGSRGMPTSQLGVRETRFRELLGFGFNRATQLLMAPGITDTQCGAKAAPRELWLDILAATKEPGYAWDVEVIAQALALRIPLAEVPISWSHQPGSVVRMGHDGARMLAALPAIRRRARARALEVRPETPIIGISGRTSMPDGAFDDANAEALAGADTDHWWFRSKAAYVNWALGRYAGRSGSEWLVDIGAGAGGVTARLAWDRRRVVAVEGNDSLVRAAHTRNRVTAVQGDAAAPPLRSRGADVACLLDVIEHSPTPVGLLQAAHDALAPGGVCIVTVPGHEWLWSPADEALGHQRRYDRRRLRAELQAGGLEVEYVGHVFSWLLLPVWLRRKVTRATSPELGLDARGAFLGRVALVLTAMERAVLRRVALPFGTSVIAVARRRER
jgi:dolichyl-phosphate beta-glucosyltransferase